MPNHSFVYIRIDGKIVEMPTGDAKKMVEAGGEFVSFQTALKEGFKTFDGGFVPPLHLQSTDPPSYMDNFAYVRMTEDSLLTLDLQKDKIYFLPNPVVEDIVKTRKGKTVTKTVADAEGYLRHELNKISGKKKVYGGVSRIGGSSKCGLRPAPEPE